MKTTRSDRLDLVLVVEFDETLRATLITVLGDAGYKVSTDYCGGAFRTTCYVESVLHKTDARGSE